MSCFILTVLLVSSLTAIAGPFASRFLCDQEIESLGIIQKQGPEAVRRKPWGLFEFSAQTKVLLNRLKIISLGDFEKTSALTLSKEGMNAREIARIRDIMEGAGLKLPEYTKSELAAQGLDGFFSEDARKAFSEWEVKKVSELLALSEEEIREGAEAAGIDPDSVIAEVQKFKKIWVH